jgi:hypothetical protein
MRNIGGVNILLTTYGAVWRVCFFGISDILTSACKFVQKCANEGGV